MKKIFLLITCFVFSLSIIAQGNSGDNKKDNGKSKQKSNAQIIKEEKIKKINDEYEKKAKDDHEREIKTEHEKKVKDEHSKKIWEGTSDKWGNGPKPSKNQPSKVRAAFQRDYPNASNISWSKYRGDWTATFGNGFHMSTALYHANGERRDTRTWITKKDVPGNVLDSVFKRRPGTRLDDIIKIEVPNSVNDIFRIKDNIQGNPEYLYYKSNGVLVTYDY